MEKLHAFELNLTHRKPDSTLISFDKIVADDIVSLLSQFQLAIAMTMKRDHEQIVQELMMGHDDIPF